MVNHYCIDESSSGWLDEGDVTSSTVTSETLVPERRPD